VLDRITARPYLERVSAHLSGAPLNPADARLVNHVEAALVRTQGAEMRGIRLSLHVCEARALVNATTLARDVLKAAEMPSEVALGDATVRLLAARSA
jgi:hypothetical protein